MGVCGWEDGWEEEVCGRDGRRGLGLGPCTPSLDMRDGGLGLDLVLVVIWAWGREPARGWDERIGIRVGIGSFVALVVEASAEALWWAFLFLRLFLIGVWVGLERTGGDERSPRDRRRKAISRWGAEELIIFFNCFD